MAKSVAGGTDVPLTAAEARNQILEIHRDAHGQHAGSALGMDRLERDGWGFTLTVKTASGTRVAVTQDKRALLYADGTNVVQGLTDPAALPTGAAQAIAYAATITPDAALGERVIVGALIRQPLRHRDPSACGPPFSWAGGFRPRD